MNTKLIPLFFAAAAALNPAPALAAGRPGAIVAYVVGDVLVKHAPDRDFVPLEADALLYPGDTIKTGPQSGASVILKSGVEVRLNEATTFGVYPKGPDSGTLSLATGQVWTRVIRKIGKATVISTPAAICAIRGTEADIRYTDRLTVKVYEGHVDVRNRFGERALAEGEMTQVLGPHSAPSLSPRLLAASLREKWHDRAGGGDILGLLHRLKPSIRPGGKTGQVPRR